MLEQANHRRLQAAEGALLNLVCDRGDEEHFAAARWRLVAIDGPPSVFQFAHLELEQARDSGRDLFGLGLRISMGHAPNRLLSGRYTHCSGSPLKPVEA